MNFLWDTTPMAFLTDATFNGADLLVLIVLAGFAAYLERPEKP